jgi:hypothetical protein
MNDYQYTNLRNYAEEQSSLLQQLLEAQNKTNELLQALTTPQAPQPVAQENAKGATKKGKPEKPGATPKAGWNS